MDDVIPVSGISNPQHPPEQLEEIIVAYRSLDEHLASKVKAFRQKMEAKAGISTSTTHSDDHIHWFIEDNIRLPMKNFALLTTSPQFRLDPIHWYEFMDATWRFLLEELTIRTLLAICFISILDLMFTGQKKARAARTQNCYISPFLRDWGFKIPVPGDLPDNRPINEIRN